MQIITSSGGFTPAPHFSPPPGYNQHQPHSNDNIYQGKPIQQNGPTAYRGGNAVQAQPTTLTNPITEPSLQDSILYKTIEEIQEAAKNYKIFRNEYGALELFDINKKATVGDLSFSRDGSVKLIHIDKHAAGERNGAGSVFAYLYKQRMGEPLKVHRNGILPSDISPSAMPYWQDMVKKGLAVIID